jgi:predicted nucleic-acid-binding protein
VTAVLDTSVLVRHFTHDDPVLGARASSYLGAANSGELILTDVVLTEMVVVLERYYGQPRAAITQAVRSLVAAPQIAIANAEIVTRAADLYEVGSSFVDAYAVAVAESEGCGVASFDRRIARQTKVPRIEP